MPDTLIALDQQIADAEETLHLIAEQKSKFVEQQTIPLDLLKNERHWEETLEALRLRRERLLSVDNPYRGLEPFERAHAANYFGREADVDKLLAKLPATNFIAVVGASGSGKSSLVRAGLAHALAQDALPGSRAWPVILFKPSQEPLFALVAALIEAMTPDLSLFKRAQEARDLAGALLDSPQPLLDSLTLWRQQARIDRALLVADQFEEFFTYRPLVRDRAIAPTGDGHAAFAGLLATLARQFAWLHQLLTLRADFTGYLQEDAQLGPLADHGWVNLLRMGRDDQRRAVELPATHSGRRFEEGLVDHILADLDAQPGQLPLLQFALTELWNRQDAAGQLTHAAYTAIHGVGGAIANYAERRFNALDAADQTRLPDLFVALVQAAPREQGVDFVRQRVRTADLPADLHSLAQRLAGERLVVTDRDAAGAATVEVVHEALLREWPRLQGWLLENQEFLLWRQRLAGYLADWSRSGRNGPGALLAGGILAEAERWMSDRPDGWREDERAYVTASCAHRATQEAEHQRSEEELRKAVARAERSRRKAVARQLANFALSELAHPEDPSGSRALLLAREAVLVTLCHDEPAEVMAQDALQRAADKTTTFRVSPPQFHHTAGVLSAAFSPDGRTVVTASADQTARLWNAANGHELYQLLGHTASVWSAALSPDGHTVVTASTDTTARLWDAQSGHELRQLLGHTARIWSAAFSPDGRTVATASDDQTARLWDAQTGRELRQLKGHTGRVLSAAFSPDGRTIVTASNDQTARLWDTQSGRKLRQLKGHTDRVWSAAFSPDGRTIVTASNDQTARLWDAQSGRKLRQLKGHTARVLSATFSPDGHTVVTASDDKSARLWDAKSGRLLRQLHGHTAGVFSAAFSPDGRTIVTASDDYTARLWGVATERQPRQFKNDTTRMLSAAFSPDGSNVTTASVDGIIQMWDITSGHELRTFQAHIGSVSSIVCSPDGRTVVTAKDDTVFLWNTETGQFLRRLQGHRYVVRSAAFSLDSLFIVTVGDDRAARIWVSVNGRKLRRLLGHVASILSATFSPDGRFVVTASADSTARVWEATSGREMSQLHGHTADVLSAAVSPDGRFVVTASADSTARVWEAASGREIRQLHGHTARINSAAFSPDGRTVVTASDDHTARLWDVQTGRELRQLRGHTDRVLSAVFSPDGRTVVTASDDHTALLWLASIEDLLAEAARRIQRDPPIFTEEERRRFLIEG